MEMISPGIGLIRPPQKCHFPYSNSLYISGRNSSLLIDAGSGLDSYKDILADPPGQILLSHYHFDHNHCLESFQNVPALAGREELWAYADQTRYMDALGYQRWDELMGSPRPGLFADVFEQPDDVPVKPGYRPLNIAASFQDGDEIYLGGLTVVAIHTPGHTPGHYAFYIPERGVLFSGDIDLSPWGPWYSAEVSDFDAMEASINRIRLLRPRILISSHRQQVFTDDLDRLLREHLKVPLTKERMLLDYLEEPRTLLEIAGQDFVHVYPPRTQFQVFWNRMMISKHLERLLLHGLVIKNKAGLYVADPHPGGYPARAGDF